MITITLAVLAVLLLVLMGASAVAALATFGMVVRDRIEIEVAAGKKTAPPTRRGSAGTRQDAEGDRPEPESEPEEEG